MNKEAWHAVIARMSEVKCGQKIEHAEAVTRRRVHVMT